MFRIFTSADQNYWRSSSIQFTNSAAAVDVPGYGIVTLYGVAQPTLGATNLGNSQIALSWQQAGAGFVLESASSLNPPTAWTMLTNSGTITNDVANVTLSVGGMAGYYRLMLP